MIISPRFIFILSVFMAALLGACQTTRKSTATPAVLKSGDEKSMTALKAALAQAMNKTTVRLGASDVTKSSSVTVLPPNLGPLEGHSMAMPTQFDIMIKDRNCYVVRRDTGEEFWLDGVVCGKVSTD